MTARRLLLSSTALELLRRRVLPDPRRLPPGFALAPVGDAPVDAVDAAVALLLRTGAATGEASAWDPHRAVADDLRVLSAPEVAVTVRASRPGLDVNACIALCGVRGAGLLRTGDTAVQLSCFPAADLATELARVVPAADSVAPARKPEELPLDLLLHPGRTRLGSACGMLRATVGGAAVQWVWDRGGWIGLEPLPSRGGRPWVRLVPVTPADLGAWVAPLLARAAA